MEESASEQNIRNLDSLSMQIILTVSFCTGLEAIELASSALAEESVSKQKKQKSEKGASGHAIEPVLESIQTFSGHTDGATCVSWPTDRTIFSGSMDFTVSHLSTHSLNLV